MGKIKENLMSLKDAVDEAYNKASNADWDGTPSEHLWSQYRLLKQRLENGEIYEPLF
jgi:hypothetical protein